MLKWLSCFQFQCASFSDSSHISAKHGIVLFRPVPKYLRGKIYNGVLSSASLSLWILHSGELAPRFWMISSMLLKASFCMQRASLVLLVFMPSMLHSLKVTTAPQQPAFASFRAYLRAQYLKDCGRRERESCASTLPGEENPKPCLLSVGTLFAFSPPAWCNEILLTSV